MVRLPNIVGDIWFNSSPLTTKDLTGKIVLIDFWTYTCVNCIRTLPYVNRWWRKYKDKGLVVIGIHTPEFEFEKNPLNVGQAIKDLEVDWPVVLDNDYINWNNFANRYWPAKYIADRKGEIVYDHFGEGAYNETEEVIRKLLQNDLQELPPVKTEEEQEHLERVCFIPTPELYCGYVRGNLSNPQYFNDTVADYTAPVELVQDSIALNGKFLARDEYVESKGEGATILLDFYATEINLVLKPVGENAEAKLLFNGHKAPEEILGVDIGNNGVLTIQMPRMYNLLKSSYVLDGILSLQTMKNNFQAYAFTFSGCTS